MAFKPALTVKRTGRRRVCSVYKCKDNNTVMVHRGKHSSFESIFLCEDCIRELVHGYIDVIGEEKAREVFASVIDRLTPGEKPDISETEAPETEAPETVEPETEVPDETKAPETAKKASKKQKSKGE